MAYQIKCTDNERAKIIKNSENIDINGIDYLEIIEPQKSGDIPLLIVFCFRSMNLNEKNVVLMVIRIKNIGCTLG